jgi:hypothetical protein
VGNYIQNFLLKFYPIHIIDRSCWGAREIQRREIHTCPFWKSRKTITFRNVVGIGQAKVEWFSTTWWVKRPGHCGMVFRNVVGKRPCHCGMVFRNVEGKGQAIVVE